MEQNAQGRRPNFHRGRRGDRRGSDRRSGPPAPDQGGGRGSDQVDVEQIMREIRSRIAQRHGIDLSRDQIQELAARRLEAILDPRTLSPSLMDQLRKGAAATPDPAPPAPDPGFSFEESTIFDTHRGILRFIRALLKPILKLFFNPNPIAHALHTQARINRAAAEREAARVRQQLEWNALHYEVLQRLVTEISRVSVEMQALTLRVESLSARVDYNDRRVRTLESTGVSTRSPQPHSRPAPPPAAAAEPSAAPGAGAAAAPDSGEGSASPEGQRRKRRRRRGRRSGGAADAFGATPGAAMSPAADAMTGDLEDGDEAGDGLQPGDAAEPDLDQIAESAGDSPQAATAVPVDVAEPPAEGPAPADVAEPPADVPAPPEALAPAGPPPADQPPTFAAAPATAPAAEPVQPVQPVQPTPPSDEPAPDAPVDRPDPGPPDR